MEENHMEVPEGWKNFDFDKAIETIRNGFSGEQVDYITVYPVTRIETISDWRVDLEKVGYVNHIPPRYKLQKGDILFSNINSIKHIGKLAYLERNFELYHGMNLLLFRFNDEIDSKFIFFYLLTQKNWFEKVATQAINQASINQTTLENLDLIIPKSLTEQRQIAAILSKVDEAISQTERLIAKYTRIKTGLIQDLLTRGIDEHGHIRSEETHAFKDSPLGRIPEEWELIPLGKLSEISSGLTLGKEYPKSGTKEMPYLRVANVQDGYLDLSEIKYVRIPVAQIDKLKLEVGDVLMNEGGDYDKLGRGAVWSGEIVDCLHQNHVFKVRLDKMEMLPEYLSVYSASNYGKSFFIVSSKQSTNLASINKTQLSEFPILRPKLKEQIKIISMTNEYSTLLQSFDNSLFKLQSLKTGLMQDLLSGKVRVNHLVEEMTGVCN